MSINLTNVLVFFIIMFGTVPKYVCRIWFQGTIQIWLVYYKIQWHMRHKSLGFFVYFFFFKCLYCYNKPRRKEINLVWAGKEQKLASVTPFFNSIIATCCVDFNVLYCLWKMYFSFVMRVQTAVMKDEWNDKFTVVNGEGNEEESQMDSNTLGYLMICYDKHYNNFYID